MRSETGVMREVVVVTKLSNGFLVDSNTTRSAEGKYCANMKGVVAELYRVLEGTVKMTPDQLGSVVEMLKESTKGNVGRKREKA